jgi:hypothetical protein
MPGRSAQCPPGAVSEVVVLLVPVVLPVAALLVRVAPGQRPLVLRLPVLPEQARRLRQGRLLPVSPPLQVRRVWPLR